MLVFDNLQASSNLRQIFDGSMLFFECLFHFIEIGTEIA